VSTRDPVAEALYEARRRGSLSLYVVRDGLRDYVESQKWADYVGACFALRAAWLTAFRLKDFLVSEVPDINFPLLERLFPVWSRVFTAYFKDVEALRPLTAEKHLPRLFEIENLVYPELAKVQAIQLIKDAGDARPSKRRGGGIVVSLSEIASARGSDEVVIRERFR